MYMKIIGITTENSMKSRRLCFILNKEQYKYKT